MDNFDAVLKALRRDDTPLLRLVEQTRLPFSTIREAKAKVTKYPRVETLRRLARHYGL